MKKSLQQIDLDYRKTILQRIEMKDFIRYEVENNDLELTSAEVAYLLWMHSGPVSSTKNINELFCYEMDYRKLTLVDRIGVFDKRRYKDEEDAPAFKKYFDVLESIGKEPVVYDISVPCPIDRKTFKQIAERNKDKVYTSSGHYHYHEYNMLKSFKDNDPENYKAIVKDIIDMNSALLEDIGFVNVDKYNHVSDKDIEYIYPNKAGKELIAALEKEGN